MRAKRNTILQQLASAAMLGLAVMAMSSPARALVVWTFDQVGNDVVATASGEFMLTNPVFEQFIDTDFFRSDANGLYAIESTGAMDFPPGVLSTSGGQQGVFNFLADADTGTGKFGHVGTTAYVDPDVFSFANNYTAEVNASLTWLGLTIDQVLGVGQALPGNAITVWSDQNGQQISIVRADVAVPLPAAAWLLLGGLGALGLVARRRRAA